jgi:hypothetical protein
MIVELFPSVRARLSSSTRYAPMDRWLEYSGLSRPSTYLAIANGQIAAKKEGRKLLIDVESGDRYLDMLPNARSQRAQPTTPTTAT